MRIISWNVNGLRASYKNGFLDWLFNEDADIVCLQEIKAEKGDLPEDLRNPKGYESYYSSSKTKKGYSGVLVYAKIKPKKIERGIGIKDLDDEGRTLVLYFNDFVLINSYFPNSGMENRLATKLLYNDELLKFMEKLRKQKKKIILCGDLNVAHEEIDLARPKENKGRAGFRDEERDWFETLVNSGYVDTFRYLYPEKKDAYTWWDMKSRARDRNVGWRIDYFIISSNLLGRLRTSFILDHVMGSDHAPIGIDLG